MAKIEKKTEKYSYAKKQILSGFSIKLPLIVAIVCLFLGTIFVFGMRYWVGMIEKREAISDIAIFESYEIERGNPLTADIFDIKQIEIKFKDRDGLFIDGASASNDVLKALGKLKSGEVVSLVVHPNSNTVLEIKNEYNTVLEFDEAMGDLQGENIGFTVLGVFMYFVAILAIVSIAKNIKERNDILKNIGEKQ